MIIRSIIIEKCDSSNDGHLNRKGSNSVHELTKGLVDDIRLPLTKQKIAVLSTKSVASRDGGTIVACNLVGSDFNVFEGVLPEYEDIATLSAMINKYEGLADLVIVVTDDPQFSSYLESYPPKSLHFDGSGREYAPYKRNKGKLTPSHIFSGSHR
ncbi:MAG: hypothetical protein WCJ36_00480 [Candidatus Saccharibacteria bacterium]